MFHSIFGGQQNMRPAPPPLPATPVVSLSTEVPDEVIVAFRFANLTVDFLEPRIIGESEGFEQHSEYFFQPELMPKHEAAFNQACNVLGRYFDAGMAKIEMSLTKECVKFAETCPKAAECFRELDRREAAQAQGEADARGLEDEQCEGK